MRTEAQKIPRSPTSSRPRSRSRSSETDAGGDARAPFRNSRFPFPIFRLLVFCLLPPASCPPLPRVLTTAEQSETDSASCPKGEQSESNEQINTNHCKAASKF